MNALFRCSLILICVWGPRLKVIFCSFHLEIKYFYVFFLDCDIFICEFWQPSCVQGRCFSLFFFAFEDTLFLLVGVLLKLTNFRPSQKPCKFSLIPLKKWSINTPRLPNPFSWPWCAMEMGAIGSEWLPWFYSQLSIPRQPVLENHHIYMTKSILQTAKITVSKRSHF